MIDAVSYQAYCCLLKKELICAMGCTEPIAIAYCAAVSRAALGGLPDKVRIVVSGNIVKNVKSVIVPNTGNRKGLTAAAAIGILGGDEQAELEVISRVSRETIEKLPAYLVKKDILNALALNDANGLVDLNDVPGTLRNVGAIYGVMTAFAHSEQAEDWTTTLTDADGKEFTYDAKQYYDYVNQQIAAAANSGKDGGEKLSDILAALGQFGSFVQDEDGNLTDQFLDYVDDPTEPENAQINKDLDGYINAMQALSQNQDGLVAAGILEDGADGGNISPILDKLFTQ